MACSGTEFSIKEGFLDSFTPLERETGTARELAQEKNRDTPGSNKIKDTIIFFRIFPYRRLAVNSSFILRQQVPFPGRKGLKNTPFYRSGIAGKFTDTLPHIPAFGVEPIGAGTGSLEDALFRGAGYNLLFLHIAQGPDDAYGVFPVSQEHGHGREYSLRCHVHKEGFNNIVQMMPQGNLVEPVFHRIF
jgi:hypothetical protein